MTDIQKLKELAQRVVNSDPASTERYAALAEYGDACAPAVTLGLIARLEAHETVSEEKKGNPNDGN